MVKISLKIDAILRSMQVWERDVCCCLKIKKKVERHVNTCDLVKELNSCSA